LAASPVGQIRYCATWQDTLGAVNWTIPNPLGNIFGISLTPNTGSAIQIYNSAGTPLGNLPDNYVVTRSSDGSFVVGPTISGTFAVNQGTNTTGDNFCIDVNYYMPSNTTTPSPYRPSAIIGFNNTLCSPLAVRTVSPTIPRVNPSVTITTLRRPLVGCVPFGLDQILFNYTFRAGYQFTTPGPKPYNPQ